MRIRPTIPARLARTTVTSPNWDVARAKARSLYRDYYRAAPEICSIYLLNIPPSQVRAKFRQMFEQNHHVQDLQAVDVLLAKGHMEYQEFVNAWKMSATVMKVFEVNQIPPLPNTFMERFLNGKDEGQVRPVT